MKIFLKKYQLYFFIALSTLPWWWLLTQLNAFGTIATLANTAGLMGGTLLIWQVILSHRFLAKKFTDDYQQLITVHILLGTYGTLLVLVHPLLILQVYSQDALFLILPQFETRFNVAVTAGRIAWWLWWLVWLSSAVLRKRIAYRLWQYLHYLSWIMVAFVLIHSRQIGTFLNTFPWLMSYWNILTSIFISLVLWRLAQVFNLGRARYQLIKKEKDAAEVTVYTFQPLGQQKLLPRVGQFVYLKPNFFGENHPFTVMSSDEKTGQLQFGIKAVGRFTRQLEQLRVGDRVFIDGPYGIFTQAGQNNEPKVIIAGGIGITPFVELIRRFGQHRTKLFYANRYLEDALLREEFQQQLGENYLEVISREKKPPQPVIAGRISKSVLAANLTKKELQQAKFFICGSPGFTQTVRKIIAQLEIPSERVFAEEFEL